MDWILDFEPSPRFPLYTRGNVAEVFPDPITPLNATTGFLQNFEDGYRDAFVDSKVWKLSIYEGEVRYALLGCLGGFVYINMSYLRVFAKRVPGYTPDLLDLSYGVDSVAFPYVAEPWHVDDERTVEVQEWIDHDVLGDTDLQDLDADRQAVLATRASRPAFESLSDAELVSRLRGFNPYLRQMFRQHALVTSKAGYALGLVVALAESAGCQDRAFDVVGGVGDVDSTGPSVVLTRIAELVRGEPAVAAEFDRGLDDLLARLAGLGDVSGPVLDALAQARSEWGFRGEGEWELRRDTWETDPTLPLAQVDRLRSADRSLDPSSRMAESSSRREASVAAVRAALPDDTAETWNGAVRAAQRWVRARERTRTTSAMLLHEQRVVARELGRRAHDAGYLADPLQVFQLLESELDAWLDDPSAWTAVLAEREQTYLPLFDLVPPFMVDGEVPDRDSWARRSNLAPPTDSSSTTLTGAPGSAGVVEGRARVVTSPSQVDELDEGDVLVASSTDPSWTPLFLTAAAVVTEVGGIFSHGPIVCRELGTPCVVGVEDACRLIKDGTLVRVDGTTGTVTVLETDARA